MRQKNLEEYTLEYPYLNLTPVAPRIKTRFSNIYLRWGFVLCTFGFVLGILLTVTPLTRMPDRVVHLQSTLGSLIAMSSSWLPKNLGLVSDPVNALASTACVEFFLLLGLVTLCYSLAAFLTTRQIHSRDQRFFRWLIWAGTLIAGSIYVFTPAMLSHDILVYIGYGRVLNIYHANPYFIPIAFFPRDPFTATNLWAKTVSIYGPIWIVICGVVSQFVTPTLTNYTLTFRFFALAIHLSNIWLVGRTLQYMNRAPQTVTLSMVLYAWNPLMLLESSLGGHNDLLMIHFVLLGVLLAARAEQRDQLLTTRGSLPPVGALTLAILVKFTALPILVAYLLFLLCKAVRPIHTSPHTWRQLAGHWQPALLLLIQAFGTILLLMLLGYGPFWFGHTLETILVGFKQAPSALYADNSFMHSAIVWLHRQNQPATTFPWTLLTYRPFWNILTSVGPVLCLLLGGYTLWRTPTTRQFVWVALITLIPVLLTTPWFFSWYVTWIVALAAVSLSVQQSRWQAALLAFTLTFSVSALLTYLFTNNYQPFHSWAYLVSAITTIPPTCAFFLTLVLWQTAHHSTLRGLKQCSKIGSS